VILLAWLLILGCGNSGTNDGPAPAAAAGDTDAPDGGPCEWRWWGPDRDRDGFGVPEVASCEPPESGWTDRMRDCDDSDPSVFPGAPEACAYDGIDEDCDGGPAWYVDEDGDGFGTDEVYDCAQPRAPEPGDCDDADPSSNPGAVEICADGIDQDCDGAHVPCGVHGRWDARLYHVYAEGSHVQAGDLDGDGAPDLLVRWPQRLLVYAGPFERASVASTEAKLEVAVGSGHRGSWFDGDGDGDDEIVVTESSSGGWVWVDFDPQPGRTDRGDADVMLSPAAALDAAPDSDGDGIDELALSTTDGSGASRVVLVELPANSRGSPWDFATSWSPDAWQLADLGDTDGDGLDDIAWAGSSGVSVASGPLVGEIAPDLDMTLDPSLWRRVYAPGDLDGDGLRDLAVHTEPVPTRDHCADWVTGTLYLHLAPFGPDVADAEASITSHIGLVAELGDVDADGANELFLDQGTGCDTSPGQAWVLSGPYAGAMEPSESAITEIAWADITYVRADGAVGADLDQDGTNDLAVSTGDTRSLLFFGGPGP
jgi:hypothetical protein